MMKDITIGERDVLDGPVINAIADQRIAKLKRGLVGISPKIEELERAAGAHIDLDEAMRALAEERREVTVPKHARAPLPAALAGRST